MSAVRTQAELDAAIERGDALVEIRSDQGVWLIVRDHKSSRVVARGSSSVEARGSSSVEAWGSSSVEAWESSSVVASPKVAVHLYSATVTLSGGVLIDCTKVDTDPREWCHYHGVTVSKSGVATVYKAVDDKWTTPRRFDYSPGRKPTAPDWTDDRNCGGGLHFSPTPREALEYHTEATRFVAVGIKVADLRPIPGGTTAKCKTPRVVRACVEVDIDGNEVTA